jgi:prevent-host-death family protein
MAKAIKASEFKAKCLALIEEISRTGETVVVTKRGEPLVDVIPHRPKKRSPFGMWKDSVRITGDIISPIDVEWEALK